MELTPQILHAVEFREARRGGYNTRDVDDFIERVAAGVGELQERIRQAMARAEAAEARLLETQRMLEEAQRRPAPAPAPPPPAGDTAETDEILRRTLVLAQRTADTTIKEAREEANRILAAARDEVGSLQQQAEQEARDGVRDARERAEAEVDELLATRDRLAHDVEVLRDHLVDVREAVRASAESLRRLAEDDDVFPRIDEPELSEVERPEAPAAPEPDRP